MITKGVSELVLLKCYQKTKTHRLNSNCGSDFIWIWKKEFEGMSGSK